MTQERLHYLLVSQFETKPDVQDKINTRGTKIGIASPGIKDTKADTLYNKQFKR